MLRDHDFEFIKSGEKLVSRRQVLLRNWTKNWKNHCRGLLNLASVHF